MTPAPVPRPDRPPRALGVRVLVAALVVQVVLGGAVVYGAVNGFPLIGGGEDAARDARAGEAGTAAPRPSADRFDAARAWADLKAQVALGPRPAGSAASRRLAERLRRALPAGRFEAVPGGLRNVVGELPGRGPPIVLAAHHDSKDVKGFVGANDGASGTATVLELARALRRERAAGRGGDRAVRFALFDGEESPRGVPDDRFLERGLRGSRAYARRHAGETGALVLLDFVGDRRLSLPREHGSDAALWRRLRAAAKAVGVLSAFPPRTVGEVYDDHSPFTRAGVPAIDLIDFDFPCFHRRCDDLGAVSPRSLDAVGETVLQLVGARS